MSGLTRQVSRRFQTSNKRRNHDLRVQSPITYGGDFEANTRSSINVETSPKKCLDGVGPQNKHQNRDLRVPKLPKW